MAVFTWSDDMSVKVGRMDEQHKVLVGLINRLDEAMRKGEGGKVLGAVLSELVQYAKTHFQTEEALLASHAYPGLASQKTEHEAFVKKLNAMSADFAGGKTAVSVSVITFLVDWLKNHILKADRQYGTYLSTRGVS